MDYQHLIQQWRSSPCERESLDPNNSILSYGCGVRVCVRCRPVIEREVVGSWVTSRINEFEAVSVVEDKPSCVYVHQEEAYVGELTGQLSTSCYQVDRAYGPSASEEDIYNESVKPLILQMYNSKSAWCISYGVTASGKTHTSMSLYHLSACELFQHSVRNNIVLYVSMFELRGDSCYDLLDISYETRNSDSIQTPDLHQLHIREDAEKHIHVNSKCVPIVNYEDIHRISDIFVSHRATANTVGNTRSSRSHAVIKFSFWPHSSVNITDDSTICKGVFHIVDLAGCERSREAAHHSQEQIAELKAINYSLGCLKECIRANITRARHPTTTTNRTYVPYRNSKLTLLLREALETVGTDVRCVLHSDMDQNDILNVGTDTFPSTNGDSVIPSGKFASVLLISHISPCRSALHHTLNTLDFATAMISANRAEIESSQFRGPEAWTRKEVQAFVKQLDGGRVKHLARVFAMTGKVLANEWIGHIERRVVAAGGTEEEAHLIYDAFYNLRQSYKSQQKRMGKKGCARKGHDDQGTKATTKSIAEIKSIHKLKFAEAMKMSEDIVYVSEKVSTVNECK